MQAGIQVQQILDIVTIQGAIRNLARKQPGISGTLIHEGKVITILDLSSVSTLRPTANFVNANKLVSNVTASASTSAS